MKSDVLVEFLWVPADLGGHSAAPYSGMRLEIRRQQHLDSYLRCIFDVECEVLDYDSVMARGRVLCSFSANAEIPAEWFQSGQLVELLNGNRVLAVGKIISP